MVQALRTARGDKPPAYWQTMMERVNAGLAVKVINRAMEGEQLPAQQIQTALAIFNKLTPSLQAVAIKVEHKKASDINDLQSRARELGIDPALLLSVPEKKPEPVTIDQEGGTPDDDE